MLPFAARSERRAGAGATFVPFFVVAAWLAWLGAGALVDEVNLLARTDNLPGSFSLGNTLPLVARPWGFNHWSVQTEGIRSVEGSSWWFSPKSRNFVAMRCTHQASPWISDYGHFLVFPTLTKRDWLTYEPLNSSFHPYRFAAELEEDGHRINFQMVPSMHGAAFQVWMPLEGFLCLLLPKGSWQRGDGYVSGGGLLSTDHEESFFVLAEDLDGTRWNLHEAEACLEIQRSERMVLRLATSFISVKQAYLNYQEELKGQTWETLNSEAKGQWESLLSRIQVEFPNASRSNVFYTNLYRGMLFPRFLGETDGEGQLVHRSAYSKRIEPGQAVTDQGFWDAYRSHYPMLSLIFPDVLGKIMEGWVNAYKELGWLPTWSAYNQRAMMVGTMGDCSLADAIVQSHQGLLHGFNSTAAYEAIRQDAFKAPSFADLKRGLGRVALEDYIQRGYVPSDNLDLEMFAQYQSASLTLGYSLADACIAPAAEAMGEAHVAKALRARAQNFRQLFDVKSLFFRPKRSNGQWDGPLYPFRWGNGFTEASAAQARFDAPQEVEGLKELYGGKRKFCQKLREMFEERKAKFEAGTYGWIHEMYEAKMLKFGLYSHNNQPVHHVLYVAQLAGCRSFAERRLRQVMKELYTLQGWIGDEDNGEMSSWYVLSSLGLFSLVPGSDELVLGSPEVKNAKLWIPGRPVLVIRADQQSNSAIYVERVTLNGKGLPDRKVRFSSLVNAERAASGIQILDFQMSNHSKLVERVSSRRKLRGAAKGAKKMCGTWRPRFRVARG